MKKSIKHIGLTALSSLLLLTGCYDMDQYPADKVSSGSFWQDEADAKEGMMGIYSSLKKMMLSAYIILAIVWQISVSG